MFNNELACCKSCQVGWEQYDELWKGFFTILDVLMGFNGSR